MELEVWMKKNECDVCAINETGLNGDEYVEVSDEYKWIGTNRDWMRGKTGGAGFVIKSDIECCCCMPFSTILVVNCVYCVKCRKCLAFICKKKLHGHSIDAIKTVMCI